MQGLLKKEQAAAARYKMEKACGGEQNERHCGIKVKHRLYIRGEGEQQKEEMWKTNIMMSLLSEQGREEFSVPTS